MKEVNELDQLRFDEGTILLKDNLVRSSIIPNIAKELDRKVEVRGDTVIEGALYGKRITILDGDLECQGAVYAELELYVDTDAKGKLVFKKSVACSDTISSRASKCDLVFESDINAKQVALYNAYVAGSIYADEVTLENCIVIGGVFATQHASLSNTFVGTFNAPQVSLDGKIGLLLPSAFSVEPIQATPNTQMYNYSLADLGALYRGLPQDPSSGKIRMGFQADEMRALLTDESVEKQLRSYTVIGKVLAADLLDTEKFQNHFLLTAASLGPQLLRVYDLGTDAKGNPVSMTAEDLHKFFKDLLSGKLEVKDLDGTFNLSSITDKLLNQ